MELIYRLKFFNYCSKFKAASFKDDVEEFMSKDLTKVLCVSRITCPILNVQSLLGDVRLLDSKRCLNECCQLLDIRAWATRTAVFTCETTEIIKEFHPSIFQSRCHLIADKYLISDHEMSSKTILLKMSINRNVYLKSR